MILPSGGDDTAVIQAALDETGYARLARGTFHANPLNLTNRSSVTIRGDSMMGTVILPITQGQVMIDRTGSYDVALERFQLGQQGYPVTPKVGILDANAAGSYKSNVNHVDRVRTDGSFSVASHFVYGMASSSFMRSQFFNYAGMPMVITAHDLAGWGVASPFTTINTTDFAPSDITFLQCELHSMNSQWAFWLGAASNIRFYGGNVSSSAPMVSNNAASVNGTVTNPDNVIFDGTTFYSDVAPAAPYALSGSITAPYFIDRNCTYKVPRNQ